MNKLTTLCYIEKDNKYLMLHRIKKENDINHDKWIGVGGKFEWGESPEECMLREVREETGYTLTSWQYRGIITFVLGEDTVEYMSLFTAGGFEGTPIDCNEGVLEWVEKDQIFDRISCKGKFGNRTDAKDGYSGAGSSGCKRVGAFRYFK